MVNDGGTKGNASEFDQQPLDSARRMGAPQQTVGPQQQQPGQQLSRVDPTASSAMPPHEPSGLSAGENGTAPPPLLKSLQNGGATAVRVPEGSVQQQQRPENGTAPSKSAVVAMTSASPAAAGPAQQPQQRARQQASVPAAPATQQAAALPAASPAGRAATGAAAQEQKQQPQAAAAAGPGQQAASDLEGILARIMNLDTEGWFRHPVQERSAPNYYKIIKQPMCFEVMRSKIRGRQYVNWQEVVRDFELICNNAMKYNQKRSRVHKQALVMLRAGKKLLTEMEAEGRRAMAALVAAGGTSAAPGSGQHTPADSQAVPSSLYRSGATGPTPNAGALLCAQSTADTATTEADSEALQQDAQAGATSADVEADVDAAGYSSYEETDLDGEEEDGGASGQQAAAAVQQQEQEQQLLEYVRNAVLVQPWGSASAAGAAAAAAQAEQKGAAEEEGQRPQQEQQPAAAASEAAVGGGPAHSKEWKHVRRVVEWRVRWLEHRLTELQHQRQRYQRQLAAEQRCEAAAATQEPVPSLTEEKQLEQRQDGGGAQQPVAQPQQQQEQQAAAPRLRAPRQRRELPNLQLLGLLQHPFFAEHSVVGARQQAASAAGATSAPVEGPSAMDCDDFPAEAHAALELLDQRLSSLRRQLVALQKPSAQAALQRLGSVRVPGYRGSGLGRRGSGFTPRGTPRSGSFIRDPSLAKRRRLQEYDMGELITPLGAPKFVERAQVKTIDTPRVRPVSPSELKKRQAAIDAYELQRREGSDDKKAAEAIDALCPGEASSDEDTSDEAFLSRHQKMEAEERARYEAVLGAAVKKNKQPIKVGKDRAKQHQPLQQRPAVARTASAPVPASGGVTGGGGGASLASPAGTSLQGAVSAPPAATSGPAPGNTPTPNAAAGGTQPSAATAGGAVAPAAATPSTAGTLAAPTPTAAGNQQQQQQQQLTAATSAAMAGLPPLPAPAQPAATAGGGGGSKPGTSAPPSSSAALTGPNGLPLVMIPMNAAMAAHMAQQMVAAAAAANQAAGKQGGSGSGGANAAAAAAAATSAAMLRPPFTLTPAMAAAMAAAGGGPLAAAAAQQAAARQAGAAAMAAAAAAAAADPHVGLPPALQAIIPNGQSAANGSGTGRKRGRPARNAGRPKR